MFRKLHEGAAQAVTIYIDGAPVTAETGESVAAVLLRQSPPWSRMTPVTQSPRAPYCMMGVCFECQVRDGMRVERQRGKRSLSA